MLAFRLVAAAVLLAAHLAAQAQYGSIGGMVLDSTGAVVPGVIVQVTSAETGHATQVPSDGEGRYLAPQLLPGFYNLRVEHPGFKALLVSQVKVDISQNVARDLVLQLGVVAETVAVSAEAALVSTVSGSVGHLVDNKEIVELPLNGRNVLQLVNASPNVSFGFGSAGQAQARALAPLVHGALRGQRGRERDDREDENAEGAEDARATARRAEA